MGSTKIIQLVTMKSCTIDIVSAFELKLTVISKLREICIIKAANRSTSKLQDRPNRRGDIN